MSALTEKAILRSFDAVTYTATVAPTSTVTAALRTVAVSRGIAAAAMVAGRWVAVAMFDPNNPADAVVVAVWT